MLALTVVAKFSTVVIYACKLLITLRPGPNVIKLFCPKYMNFALSHKGEKLARDKHTSILQKFRNYRQKSFITMAPGTNVIKHFYARKSVRKKLECLSRQTFSALSNIREQC